MPITLDFEKVRSLAKRGHVSCHGEGIFGRQADTGLVILCQCVLRSLKRQGIDLDDSRRVQEALGPDSKE
jgi:hypothetical protein